MLGLRLSFLDLSDGGIAIALRFRIGTEPEIVMGLPWLDDARDGELDGLLIGLLLMGFDVVVRRGFVDFVDFLAGARPDGIGLDVGADWPVSEAIVCCTSPLAKVAKQSIKKDSSIISIRSFSCRFGRQASRTYAVRPQPSKADSWLVQPCTMKLDDCGHRTGDTSTGPRRAFRR